MSSLPPLLIVGAGGLGRGVAALIETINTQKPTWDLIGFVDDDASMHERTVSGYPVCGDVNWLARQNDCSFVIAIGDSQVRQHIASQLEHSDVESATLIHPSVSNHWTTEIASGTVVYEGVAADVNLQIGPHTILNFNCTIGHDSKLDSFVTLHPGVHVSGSAQLDVGVTMGAGSVVLPETKIGANSTVGAGAIVTEDLPPNCTAVGAPARPLS